MPASRVRCPADVGADVAEQEGDGGGELTHGGRRVACISVPKRSADNSDTQSGPMLVMVRRVPGPRVMSQPDTLASPADSGDLLHPGVDVGFDTELIDRVQLVGGEFQVADGGQGVLQLLSAGCPYQGGRDR